MASRTSCGLRFGLWLWEDLWNPNVDMEARLLRCAVLHGFHNSYLIGTCGFHHCDTQQDAVGPQRRSTCYLGAPLTLMLMTRTPSRRRDLWQTLLSPQRLFSNTFPTSDLAVSKRSCTQSKTETRMSLHPLPPISSHAALAIFIHRYFRSSGFNSEMAITSLSSGSECCA